MLCGAECINSTPDEELAREVSAALIATKLLDKDEEEAFQKKFASGSLLKEDWKNMYEKFSGKANRERLSNGES